MKPCEETLDESRQPKEWHHPSQISLVVCQKSNYGWWLKGEKLSLVVARVAVGGGASCWRATEEILSLRRIKLQTDGTTIHRDATLARWRQCNLVHQPPCLPLHLNIFPPHTTTWGNTVSQMLLSVKRLMKMWNAWKNGCMCMCRTGRCPLWGETKWKATLECRLYIVVQKLQIKKIVSLQKSQALKR